MRIAVTAALLASLVAGSALAETTPSRQPKAAQPAPKAQTTTAKPQAAKPQAAAKPSLALLAAQGEPDAQFQLGQAYATGKGAKKNLSEAAYWYALAAGNGSKDGAIALARAYEQATGVKRDLTQAALAWLRAGQLGDDQAKTRFIELFVSGQATDIGGPSGATLVEDRAKTGDTAAILAVAHAYEDGQGVLPDPIKARSWYLQAAYANNAEAQFRLGRMLLTQPGAWRLIFTSPEDEAKNTDRGVFYPSRKVAQDAAKSGQIPDIVRPGMVEAETWLRAAAQQGHVEAQYTLGAAFLDGKNLPFNLKEAVRWLSAAAWGGHPQAMLVLADLAAQGQGFATKDPVRAWVNYDIAASEGLKQAEDARDALGKTMNARQLNRARQLAQDLRNN